LVAVDHVAEVADGSRPARRLADGDTGSGGRGVGLAEIKAPGDGSGDIIKAFTLLVVDGEQAVRLVCATDINLEGSYRGKSKSIAKRILFEMH
jgi:hypothetical protein